MKQPVITFTTDFGLSDSYVAQMKGVILSLNPKALIVDISHLIPPHDIATAARVIDEAAPNFPEHTVHVVVVDPGVGTDRRRLIVQCALANQNVSDDLPRAVPRRYLLVGPDNGCLSRAAPLPTRSGVWSIEDLSVLPPYLPDKTFEGRSIFAPVAALLAAGHKPGEFGPQIEEEGAAASAIVELSEHRRLEVLEDEIIGEIQAFDSFGNALTTINARTLPPVHRTIVVQLPTGDTPVLKRESYEQIPENELGWLANSQGILEIACKRASARVTFGLTVGCVVRVPLR